MDIIIIKEYKLFKQFNSNQEETNNLGQNIDPNRDFPYDNSEEYCLQTKMARVVNKLFTDHLF